MFPIYTYLSAGGTFPFSLTTENGIPVLSVSYGDPTVGPCFSGTVEHPRLLYTAAERELMLARKNDNFQQWYDQIKSTAQQPSDFPVPNSQGIISEQDWATKEVRNAHIALNAAVVYDLERDKT